MDKMTAAGSPDSGRLSGAVFKAMSVFGGVQVVNILCAAVRAKLLAVFAGPAAVGLLAIYNSAIALLTAATQLNFNQSAVREIAASSGSDTGKIIRTTRVWGRRLGLFGLAVMLLLSPILSLWSFGDYKSVPAFAVLSLTLLLSSMSGARQAVLQATRRLRDLASASVWSYIISTVFTAVLVITLGLRAVVPVILAVFIAQWIALAMRRTPACEEKPAKDEINLIGRRFLSLGAWMTASSCITFALAYVFAVYVARGWSDSVLGCYQAGYTMVNAYMGLLFNAIVMDYYPRLAGVASHPHRTGVFVSQEITLVMWCLIPILCVFAAIADLLVTLMYSEEFIQVVPYILISTVGVVLRALSWSMAYTILARGDGRTYIFTEALSSVVGLLLNVILFREWSFAGLGVAYTAWYAVYTIIIWWVYHFRYRLHLGKGVVSLTLAAIIVVALAVAGKMLCGWWLPAAIGLGAVFPALRKFLRMKVL